MTKTVRTIIDMIENEVGDKKIDTSQYVLTNEELIQLYKLSKSHDLVHLVGDALMKNDLINSDEINANFQNWGMFAIYRYENRLTYLP